MYSDFEPQARAGKGVKSFYFNRTGSNGTKIAGAVLASSEEQSFRVTQKISPYTDIIAGEVLLQGKTGKGIPLVMALMDDYVTGIQ